MYVYIYTHIHNIHIYTYTHVRVYVCMYTFICVCCIHLNRYNMESRVPLPARLAAVCWNARGPGRNALAFLDAEGCGGKNSETLGIFYSHPCTSIQGLKASPLTGIWGISDAAANLCASASYQDAILGWRSGRWG